MVYGLRVDFRNVAVESISSDFWRRLVAIDWTGSEYTTGGLIDTQRNVIALDPWLADQIWSSISSPWVNFDQPSDDELGLSWYFIREGINAPLYLWVELPFVGPSEREISSKESEEQDTERPHINLPAIVLRLPHQLRSHVRWSSTEDLELLAILAKSSKAKVYNFDHVGSFLDENIIKLDISMGNSFTVEVVECLCNLLEEPPASSFLNLSVGTLLLDILMEADSPDVICHDADFLLSFYKVVHFDDVGVVDLLQSHDLALHCFSLHAVIQFWSLVYLYGILSHRSLVVANVYSCVGSLADWFTYLVVLQLTSEGWLRKVGRWPIVGWLRLRLVITALMVKIVRARWLRSICFHRQRVGFHRIICWFIRLLSLSWALKTTRMSIGRRISSTSGSSGSFKSSIGSHSFK